jgi:transposase-like protein
MTSKNPFKYFKTSSKIIRLAIMYYVRYPLSFRQVEDASVPFYTVEDLLANYT